MFVDEDLSFSKENEKPISIQNPLLQPFKVEAQIKIPAYNEVVDVGKLDNWLD